MKPLSNKFPLYDLWNIAKKNLESSTKSIVFKQRQIWWIHIGQNLGSESYGKGKAFSRPVLIYKKLSKDLFVGLPITSKVKTGTWFTNILHRGMIMTVQLNQVRIFDQKRLMNHIGEVDDEDFNKIKTGFSSLYNV